MRIEDITVEIRDNNLARVGQVSDYNLVGALFISRFNNVGSWSLRMPFGDPLVDLLRTPGFGVIVTGAGNEVLLSGPTLAAKLVQSSSDVRGEWLIEGADDSIILGERLCYPEPSNANVTSQTVSHDRRFGVAETVMKGYVSDNIGTTSTVERQVPGLIVGADLGRGLSLSVGARFTELQTLLYGIAESTDLGYDVKQVNDDLVFDVYEPVDRSAFIRMDIENRQLSSAEFGYASPKGTRVIVAGQGSMVERAFIERSNSASIAAETLWGRRIEVFQDSRSSEELTELEQAGDERLAEDGETAFSLSVTPTNDSSMSYPEDWGLGDVVSVVAGEIVTVAVVTEVGISVAVDGVRVAAVVGNPRPVDFESGLIARSNSQDRRISNLERNELGGDDESVAITALDPLLFDETSGVLSWNRPVSDVTQLATASSRDNWGFVIDGERVYTRSNNADQSGVAEGRRVNPRRVPFPEETGTLVDCQVGATSYALFDSGNLWMWGRNASGQLGIGNQTTQPNPLIVQTGVTDVWMAVNEGCYDRRQTRLFIQKTDGLYYCAGNNLHGSLGIGNTTIQTSWTLATGMNTLDVLSPIRRIDSYGGTIDAMVFTELEDGSVYAQGSGAQGGLGTGTTTTTNSTPIDVTTNWGGPGYETVQVICSTGYRSGSPASSKVSNNTMMLREDPATGERYIFTSGFGSFGLHGNGSTAQVTTPTIVGTVGTDIVKVARIGGGITSNFALMSDGKLWAWGRNNRGQLGIGNTTQQNTPVLTATDAGDLLAEISDSDFTPFETACFYKTTDGFIRGTGRNSTGQIGDGTTSQRNSWVPVRLPAEENIVRIGILGNTTNRFTIFVTERGRIYGTGYNGLYDLYDRTTTTVLVPMLLTHPPE